MFLACLVHNSYVVSTALLCEPCQFLLPVVGAMSISEYRYVDVFSAGLLSNVEFGADWTLYA